jgi:hypothetical protein
VNKINIIAFDGGEQSFNKNGKLEFANIICNGNSIAPMEDIMEIFHVTEKKVIR